MSENDEQRQDAIDGLLRGTLAGPAPSVRADFDERVLRELRRRSQPLDRRRQMFLAGYAVVSVVVSAVAMRGQGLGWSAIAMTTLAPLAVLAVIASVKVAKGQRVRA